MEFTDIMAPVIYPYHYEGASVYDVHLGINATRHDTGDRKTAFAITQAYGHEDLDALHAIPYLAITADARGLIWYCWEQHGGGPEGWETGIHEHPEHQ